MKKIFETWIAISSSALALMALSACEGRPETNDDSSGLLARPRPAAPIVTATDYYLSAEILHFAAGAFGNPAPILMWGYARCTAGFASCDEPTSPGPQLAALEGTTLSIHVRNALSGAFVEPTSLIIPGQVNAAIPVWFDPQTGAVTSTGARALGDYSSRVRSFAVETPADGSTVVTYSWPNIRAGTYLYQSGTHPAVQIQMGLFGALLVYPPSLTSAYDDPSTAFDRETTLLYSEIDPALHAAIEAGHFGPNPVLPPPEDWRTSTIDYRPRYFRINEAPFSAHVAPSCGVALGGRLLLRFLNAGLTTRVPVENGAAPLSLIGEDGNFIAVVRADGATVPAPHAQYSVFLPAGKTIDAIIVPDEARDIPIYDRRGALTNNGSTPGGMLAYCAVGDSNCGGWQLQLSPRELWFGRVSVGHAQQQTIVVRNAGSAPRAILSASIINDATPPRFSVAFSGPQWLAPGEQTSIAVSFQPVAHEFSQATLLLNTNDPNTTEIEVRISGAGI